ATAVLYRDGVQTNSGGFTLGSKTDAGLQIASGYVGGGGPFNGAVDDVRLYNHAITADEVQDAMYGQVLQAYGPQPADGAMHESTWANISWTPGNTAASHDVYFGDNFDDVNAGAESTFQGNQTTTFVVVGFPGFAFPSGLVPGTTYYWRVDEVEADGTTTHIGNVWSFTVPPKIAYNPSPATGAKFIDLDTTLSWEAGFGTIIHNVYFGENPDDVAAGTPDTTRGPVGGTSYSAAALELDKTYYWRVDEFDGANTHTGDVWSFSTSRPGGGVRADYYTGTNFENHILTRTDPQIDFNWSDGAPDDAVGADKFSVRWTGQLEAAFTETYTFYAKTDDGVRLWVEGQLLVDKWTNRSPTEDKGTIDLIAGQIYSVVMEYYDDESGAVAELRWSSPRTPKQLIPQGALSLPVKASSANPPAGATDVTQTAVLTWTAGDFAASHEVYFGTDEEAVRNADTSSPEYKGTMSLGSESFDPGKLQWNTTYYWRVDEVDNTNPDSPWVGGVWSFTTANFLIVDDFESYRDNDIGNAAIWQHWIDGFDVPANGSQVGYLMPPYAETTIVHGGRQSMPLLYNNVDGATNSEAEKTLTAARDWTEEGVAELSIWFHGRPASVGSFVEGPAGTFTMTASGADIWNVAGVEADEFHFAYKTLTGPGSIVAKVESVQNTNAWAKACVMIRETLTPESAHAIGCITPENGVASQGRPSTGGTSFGVNETGITAPHWVKLERDMAGNLTVSHSADGTTWQPVQGAFPANIQMSSTVYIGLALTAHDASATCEAVFSNVTITGTVSPQWAHQDIGIASNAAEPLYVAISNSNGTRAIVAHEDPGAATIDTWTEWIIDLQKFADQGVNLTDVDKISIGLGTVGDASAAGGSGTVYFDDIRLYRPE
ncbi:MAG: PA14 domain-containing protein, partial [Planctomycetota bacterium]